MTSLTQTIKSTTKSLSSPESVKGLLHQKLDHVPLPSNSALEEIIQLAREILLPGYFGQCKVGQDTLDFYIGVSLEKLYSNASILGRITIGDRSRRRGLFPSSK